MGVFHWLTVALTTGQHYRAACEVPYKIEMQQSSRDDIIAVATVFASPTDTQRLICDLEVSGLALLM